MGADHDPFIGQAEALPREYRVRGTIVRTYGVIAIASAVGGMISLCYSIWNWYFAYSNYGPAAVWRWSELPLYFSITLGVIALVAAYLWVRNRSLLVRTTEQALLVQRGSKQIRTPWDEIESITTISERIWSPFGNGRDRFQFWIQQYSGKKQRFGATLSDIQDLAASIKLRIYPLLLEKYRQQWADHEIIDLGAVQISRSGVGTKGREIQWQELSDAELQSGKLVIYYHNAGRGIKVAIPSRRVKNIDLCIQLIEGIETK